MLYECNLLFVNVILSEHRRLCGTRPTFRRTFHRNEICMSRGIPFFSTCRLRRVSTYYFFFVSYINAVYIQFFTSSRVFFFFFHYPTPFPIYFRLFYYSVWSRRPFRRMLKLKGKNVHKKEQKIPKKKK